MLFGHNRVYSMQILEISVVTATRSRTEVDGFDVER